MRYTFGSNRARWLLVAVLALPFVAGAQSNPSSGSVHKPGTLNGSGAPDFAAQVQQDVANGLYTAQQGSALVAEYEAASAKVDDSMNKAVDNVTKDVSLMLTSDQSQPMIQAIAGASSAGGPTQLGGNADQITEQANAIYTAQLQALRVTIAAQQTVQPVIQEALNEVDDIVAQRAALITANPNVSADQKFYVQQEAGKVKLAAESSFNQAMSTQIANLQAGVSLMENNKAQLIQQYQAIIEKMVRLYGPDPAKWPQTVHIQGGDIILEAQQPPPPSDDSGPGPAPSNNAASSGKSSLSSSKGTIPGNGADPALSATRNSSGEGSSGNGGNGSGNGPDPAFDAYRNQAGGRAIDAGVSSAASAVAGMPGPPPPKPTPPPSTPPAPNGIASGVAAAAEAAGTLTDQPGKPPTIDTIPTPPPPPNPDEYEFTPPPQPLGHMLVEGSIDWGDFASNAPLPALPDFGDVQSFEYGDTIPVAALQSIYAGYRLSDHTGDAMMSLNLQVPVPSAVMTVPSMQITGMPSDVMMSLDLQPALCGR